MVLSCRVIKPTSKYEKEITLKPLSLYLQKQNSISKKMGRILINIIGATILESNINDKFWLKLVLVITYIRNS